MMRTLLVILSLIAGALDCGSKHSAHAADTGSAAECLAQIAPEITRGALEQIQDAGRKLLALRSYVRAGRSLTTRWSWTADQIAAYEGSPEQHALLMEVEAVRAHFSAANPGYAIYVNSKVRSLDDQVRSWSTNDSVGTAGTEILEAFIKRFGSEGQCTSADNLSSQLAWLSNFSSSRRANIAAPGLTLHGQARAIDFQVIKNGQIIAGADSRKVETVWRAEHWDVRLKESIAAVAPSFVGPLQSPDEPWHYDYVPTTAMLTMSARNL